MKIYGKYDGPAQASALVTVHAANLDEREGAEFGGSEGGGLQGLGAWGSLFGIVYLSLFFSDSLRETDSL